MASRMTKSGSLELGQVLEGAAILWHFNLQKTLQFTGFGTKYKLHKSNVVVVVVLILPMCARFHPGRNTSRISTS